MPILALFFIVILTAFLVAIGIVYNQLILKKEKQADRCTAITHGEVLRYTMARYNEIGLPLVLYTVNGRQYTIKGPDFARTVTKTFTAPWNSTTTEIQSNLTDREHLPPVLRLSRRQNSLASVTYSPLMELYPIGAKDVQVCYNPQNPAEAFVERFCSPSPWMKRLLLASGTFCAISLIVLIILTLLHLFAMQ